MKKNKKKSWRCVCVCVFVWVSVFIATAWAHLLMAPAVDCRLSSALYCFYLFTTRPPLYLPRPCSCLWFVCRRCCGIHFCGVYVSSVGFYNAGICHQAVKVTFTREFQKKREASCFVDFCRFRKRFREP